MDAEKLTTLLVSIATPLSAMGGGMLLWIRGHGKDRVDVVQAWGTTYGSLLQYLQATQADVISLNARLTAEEQRCDGLAAELHQARARLAQLESKPPTT